MTDLFWTLVFYQIMNQVKNKLAAICRDSSN